MIYKDQAADNLNERIRSEIEKMLRVEPVQSSIIDSPAPYEDIETAHLRYLAD